MFYCKSFAFINWSAKSTKLFRLEWFAIYGMSTGVPRPYVPSELHHTVFDAFHSLSHPSVRATQRLITSCYVWPNINSDICKWAQTCLKCQRCKVQRHTITPFGSFVTPNIRFDNIYIDIVSFRLACQMLHSRQSRKHETESSECHYSGKMVCTLLIIIL